MRTDDGVVLVGVDGSEDSLVAVDWAAAEAASTGSALTVCHSTPFGPPFDLPAEATSDRLLIRGEQVVRAAAERARAIAPGLTITEVVSPGSATPTLLERSAAARLLVVGSRGTGAFRGLLLGSVSQQVAAHAACPVVVVRGLARAAPLTDAPVTVAVDWSGHQPLLAFGFDFAARHRRPLLAVHVCRMPEPPARRPSHPVELPLLPAAVYDLLTDAVTPWREKYPEVPVRQKMIDDAPAAGLINESAHSALLVVGSHGHGGFAGMLLGSVSQHVLRHGQCPVAVLR